VEFSFVFGCAFHRTLPFINTYWLMTDGGSQRGLSVLYFGNRELSGEPVHAEVIDQAEIVWFGEVAPHFDPANFSARLTGAFIPPETGAYTLGLTSVGRSRLLVDGVVLIDDCDSFPGGSERRITFDAIAGQSYSLQVEYASQDGPHWRNLRIGCIPASPADPIQEAASLAARSDVAIVFAGLTKEWEGEGADRPDMELPGMQAELIEKVAAANPRTIVVISAGSPVSMGWLDQVGAVLQAWYLGQETGHAITDVLFGDTNPSAKLPTTFPRRLQDTPTYINYPGECGKVYYGEGIFVGYRYYDKKDIAPLFPFGFGLSYTSFEYSDLELSAAEYGPGDVVQVRLCIKNTGSRPGKEIVQVYLRDIESSLVRPEKELKAFAKVSLAPGEARVVSLTLDKDALAFYNPEQRIWVVEPGDFEVLVGSSSRDIHLKGRFAWKSQVAGPSQAPV